MRIVRREIKGGVILMAFLAAAMVAPADSSVEYQEQIRPILQKFCYDCHGPERQRGDLDLSLFAEYDRVINTPEVWQMVLQRVQAFEMPPKNSPELNYSNHQRLMRWLRNLPSREIDCTQLASDRTQSFYRGYVMSRRLNRAEYNHTVRDLFGVDLGLQELLPADGGGGEGFDTAGSALFTSSIHIEKYLQAAVRAVETVLRDQADTLPPALAEARERILAVVPGEGLAPREAARRIVGPFARRAFRRPVADEEVDRLLSMFDRGWDRGDGFVPSVRLALTAVLISPHFLFLVEPEPARGGIQPLEAFPLASRLSYFIWSSMPDEELFSLAENGLLLDEEVYRQQIRRMLADEKAGALGQRFALQWLDLKQLGSEIRPDPKEFPEFDGTLSEAMLGEVVSFFNHLIRNDRSLLELIESDYTFMNESLARLYGFEEVRGPEMRLVNLANGHRGGIVGMAAVHTITSYPTRTSPVLRGKWVLEALLGDRVAPPPPDVAELDHSEEGNPLSLRQQLELHRTQPECAACHDRMDPLGFGLENFDVLGRWREYERGFPVETSGTLPSGETFSGPAGLKTVLMARKDQVIRHLTRKMTGFAFGRELNKFDDCVIDDTMEALEANGYRASVLVEEIAASLPFRNRFYPNQ